MVEFMRSISHLKMRGFLLTGSGLERLIDQDRTWLPATAAVGLSQLVSGRRPKRLVVFFGFGDSQGMWCHRTESPDSPIYLPPEWWNHGTAKSIYLFAFACESAKYMRASQLCDYIEYGIGFEDRIWFEDLNKSKASLGFWRGFLKRLYKTLGKQEILDRYSFLSVIELYARTARKLHSPSFLRRLFSYHDYLSLVPLAQQATSLREVEGTVAEVETRKRGKSVE